MLNKILKNTAAAVFMVALAININMTLNNPFAGMSTEAIATDTDSSDTGGSCEQKQNTTVQRFVYNSTWWACGVTHPAGIYIESHTVKDCWVGGTSQNCERGDYTLISNILGQPICEIGGFVPATCNP